MLRARLVEGSHADHLMATVTDYICAEPLGELSKAESTGH
jgi:hypothetical protein